MQSFYGARTWSYSEAWYLGNPGHYLTYVFTNGSASSVGGFPEGLEPVEWDGQDAAVEAGQDGDPRLRGWARRVRERTGINTVSVVSFPLDVDIWPGAFGPHGDEVRKSALDADE